MKAVEVNKLTFSYNGYDNLALDRVSFDVEQGEIMLVIGESGCGKTTLLRHLKPSHFPMGKISVSSEINIFGKSIENLSDEEASFKIGFVGQQVDETSVTDKVWHELAFGLESMGCDQAYMQARVAEMTAFFGLENIYHEKISELSGGQKQIVNLAAVMVMEPEILILDEPTSQLDPNSSAEFFHMIRKIHEELGTTIIITEHRLEDILPIADKVMVLNKGSQLFTGTPRQVCQFLYEHKLPLFRSMPVAARIYCNISNVEIRNDSRNDSSKDTPKKGTSNYYVDNKEIDEYELHDGMPLSVNEGRKFIKGILDSKDIRSFWDETDDNILSGKLSPIEKNVTPKKSPHIKDSAERLSKGDKEEAAIITDEVWFRYKKSGIDVLKACELKVPKGKITAVLGGNGAGKSTLLKLINGNITPYLGTVKSGNNTIAMLPQNPQAMFAKRTVREELYEAYSNGNLRNKWESNSDYSTHERRRLNGDINNQDDILSQVVRRFNLSECLDRHPFDLSGGQMEKLALAKIVLMDRDIILLDEPGKGMDYAFKERLGEILQSMTRKGKTILLVSHDVEFCAKYADYCGMFFDGHIVSLNDRRTFFLQNAFYTTAVRRMTKGMVDAVTIKDLYDLLGLEEIRSACDDTDIKDTGAGDDGAKDVGTEDDGAKDTEAEDTEAKGAVAEDTEAKDRDDRGESTDDSFRDTISHYKDGGKKPKISSILPPLLLLVVMPFTIYVGYALLHQRKYYFISLMLILEAVIAFFLSFEGRRPQMRDIMTIAVMSAITALSRAMFYMVPAVKPMAALTIISGVGLGGVSGFVVGALSMLVSDIFFGQGPWTPWQMFTMGLLGFLGGAVFRKYAKGMMSGKAVRTGNEGREKKRRHIKKGILMISIFGALSVLLIYGGIMNPASILMYQENVTPDMLLASYAPGFPIDCIHAGATFIFLWLLTEPMLEKLNRVKKK